MNKGGEGGGEIMRAYYAEEGGINKSSVWGLNTMLFRNSIVTVAGAGKDGARAVDRSRDFSTLKVC